MPPWIHVMEEDMPQHVSAARSRIDLLQPPPSRGKEAGRLPSRNPSAPSPKNLNEQLASKGFPGHGAAALPHADAAGDIGFPAPASETPEVCSYSQD